MSTTSVSRVMPTYSRIDIDFERGEGSWLFDSAGQRYLDAISGIAVCALGHGHPGFTRALCEQAARLVHTSNLYGIPLQRELAERLCEASGMSNAFFCNSGAEANESAIKLSRLWGHHKGVARPEVLVMEGAFHGRTLGALSATHSARHQAGFEPLLEGFPRVPFDDLPAAEAAIGTNPNIVAVLVEPIQGEGGVCLPRPGYLKGLRELCDRHSLLLMLDEVQTGNGRTGKYFAFQHEGILPDVLSTAKGLGNGFPIGACLAAGPAASLFQPGHHASTFGGSPLACAAALAVNRALREEQLVDNAAVMGARLMDGLRQRLAGNSKVLAVRGQGLMIGVALDRAAPRLADDARRRGLLLNVANGTVVRLVPPLILKADEADLIVDTLAQLIGDLA